MQETPDSMFLSSHNSTSNRYAILDTDDSSCWLYLNAVGTQKPEKDCFLFTLIKPTESLDIDNVKDSGKPPALTKEVASSYAMITDFREEEFSFVWSLDGQSVAVTRNGYPIGMILAAEQRGYSKALAKSSFFGEPWDEALFVAFFK